MANAQYTELEQFVNSASKYLKEAVEFQKYHANRPLLDPTIEPHELLGVQRTRFRLEKQRAPLPNRSQS